MGNKEEYVRIVEGKLPTGLTLSFTKRKNFTIYSNSLQFLLNKKTVQ
jgi:hypothetical protein